MTKFVRPPLYSQGGRQVETAGSLMMPMGGSVSFSSKGKKYKKRSKRSPSPDGENAFAPNASVPNVGST